MTASHREPSRAPPSSPPSQRSPWARKAAGCRGLRLWALPLCAAVFSTPTPALAQPVAPPPADAACPVPPPADTEAAKIAFRDGQAAFTEGGYVRAAELWTEAYRLDCTAHALLLNLAMAHELLGRPEDAVRNLELFNRRVPDSPYVEANRQRIDRLRRLRAEQLRARAREQRKLSPPLPVRTPQPPDTRVVPLALAAGGGIVGLTGLALYVHGRSAAASAADRCGESRASCGDAGAVTDGERARERAEIGGWLTGAGLLGAAAGTLWYALAAPAKPSTGVEWSASVSGAGPSLHVSGTY